MEIAKQLKVSQMVVYRVADHMRNSETLKDRPHSGRPQVIKKEMVKKAFEDDLALKMTKLAKRKNISMATVSRAVNPRKVVIFTLHSSSFDKMSTMRQTISSKLKKHAAGHRCVWTLDE